MSTERVRLPRKLSRSVTGGILAEEGRLHPVGAVNITLNMLPLHRVTMTLTEQDLPLAMHDLVEVYNQNGSVGVYRVIRITSTYRKHRQIELAHGLDVFSDSTFTTIEKYSGTVAGFLERIIAAQGQHIGGIAYWQLGQVDDTNPWNKEIKYDNLMECLTDIAKTEEDYLFTFDMSTFPWTLNFVARDSAVLSEFRLSRNVESCQITLDDTDMCTRLFLSVTEENTENVTDKDGVTHGIVTTSEGYYTFNNTTAQGIWGRICKTAGVYRADVPTAAALNAWVSAYFDRHSTPSLQITIDGQELNRLTSESIDELFLGRVCRVALPDYNAVFSERIVSVSYPDALRTPRRIEASLANKRETAEGSFSEIQQQNRRTGGAAGSARNKANNNEANAEKQRIVYDLQVDQDEKRFAVIASESWYSQMEGSGETLVGKYSADFEVTARRISSALSVTGVRVDANGNPVKDADGNYVFDGGSNALSSQITQTAAEIRSEVSSTASGLQSSITQQANRISLVVEGTGSSASIKAASIVLAVNNSGSSVVINANKVDLGDYATVRSLDAVDAKIANLVSGTSEFTHMKATMATIVGSYVYWREIKAGSKSIRVLNSTGGDMEILYSDLPHYHAISVSESNGVVTITQGAAQDTAGSDSFDIADTQFYQSGVSAAYTNGWNAARAKVAAPGAAASGEVLSFDVKVPSATEDEQETFAFTLQKGATPGSSGYASVARGNTVVGRIEIGSWYDAGVTAGANGVTLAYLNVSNDTSTGHPITCNTTNRTISFYPSYRLSRMTNAIWWSQITINDPGLYSAGYSAGYTAGAASVTQRTVSSITVNGTITWDAGSADLTVPVKVTYSDGNTWTGNLTVDGTKAYNAGYADGADSVYVTTNSTYLYWSTSRREIGKVVGSITAKLSNGKTYTRSGIELTAASVSGIAWLSQTTGQVRVSYKNVTSGYTSAEVYTL